MASVRMLISGMTNLENAVVSPKRENSVIKSLLILSEQ